MNFLQIRKENSSVFNLTCNLKLETFDHGTFLYKVHELLLITLHSDTSKTLLNEDALFIFSEIFLRDTKFMHYCQVFDYLQ